MDNDRCPVEPGEIAIERYQTEFRGVTVSFCCKDCIIEFDKSPEAYLAQLPQFDSAEDSAERSPMLQAIDSAWNAGASVAGLSIGLAVIAILLLGRLALGKLANDGILHRAVRATTSARGLGVLLLLTFGGEALSAHLQRHHTRQLIAEEDLEHSIHYTTFQEYGDPPLPSHPERPARLADTFYRGNDERNPALFNGGNYRTATFHIALCDREGAQLDHEAPALIDDLFLRVRFDRAPETPDYFWTAERMAKIYATSDAGRFHGRHTELADAVPMDTVEPMQSWEFRYPIRPLLSADEAGPLRGVVYLCEQRFDDDERRVGGRFHYAFQFDLRIIDGKLSAESDLWMGALYRKRSLRIWEIPEREWLSRDPVPTNSGENPTDDPTLLGIKAYEDDSN